MGAWAFTDEAFGKDATEAYGCAVSDALIGFVAYAAVVEG